MDTEDINLDAVDESVAGNQLDQESSRVDPDTVVDKKFRILDRLGGGGMGQVYLARHLILDQDIALKILHHSEDHDETSEQRFIEEAKILARLDHPHIVKVHDAGVTLEGFLYLSMEQLSGETLRDWIKRQFDSEALLADQEIFSSYLTKALGFVVDVMNGLEEAHSQGIVHRDIKPSNIILHTEYEKQDRAVKIIPKIIDFGVAKRFERDLKLTLMGQIPGTLEYIAPELKFGGPPDVRTDIYSLGVTLYEVLTGKKPESVTRSDFFSNTENLRAKLLSPKKNNPFISAELDDLCMRALESDPHARIQTVREFAEALNGFTGNTSPLENTETAISVLKGARSRVKTYLTTSAIALGALAAVLLIFLYLWPGSGHQPTVTEKESAITLTSKTESFLPSKNQIKEPPKPENSGKIDTLSTPFIPPTKRTVVENSNSKIQQAFPSEEQRQKSNEPKKRISTQPVVSTEEPESIELKKRVSSQPIVPNKETDPIHKDPKVLEDLIQQGHKELRAMRLKSAEKSFKSVLEHDAQSATALYGLGLVAMEKQEYSLAADFLDRALKSRNNPRWRIKLGIVYSRLGQTQLAKEQWQRVISDFPDNSKMSRLAQDNLDRHSTEVRGQ